MIKELFEARYQARPYKSKFVMGQIPEFNPPRRQMEILTVPDNYFPPAAPDWNATGVYMKEMVWQEQVNSLREKGFVVEEVKSSNGNAYKVSHPYYPGFVVVSRTPLGKVYYKAKNIAAKGLKFVLTALIGAVSSSVFSFLRGQ
jgi:hypothetical protein